MKLSAELSLYPLQQNYIPVIKAFIDSARQVGDIEVNTNTMSTQIYGDFDQVMELVSNSMRDSMQRFGRQVLVCKFIGGAIDPNSGDPGPT